MASDERSFRIVVPLEVEFFVEARNPPEALKKAIERFEKKEGQILEVDYDKATVEQLGK
jgi:ABC-type glycerol-3-phosphate transport system substrate-binding protein